MSCSWFHSLVSLSSPPQVILLVEHNEAFEFVLAVDGDLAVANARKVTVGRRDSVTELFPIRPLALGWMEISILMLSLEDSQRLVQTMLVKVWCFIG